MTKVGYISACLDSSGYAEAARNNILALNQVGVDLEILPISFEQKKTQFTEFQKVLSKKQVKQITAPVRIIHSTPTNFARYVKKDTYNIGYTTWETDKLPDSWVEMINTLNEVWVPSQHNVEMFQSSGVTIPIICIPHTFRQPSEESYIHLDVAGVESDDFVFYNIFQWLERKNPIGLLKAYFSEFSSTDKVVLILKSFLSEPGSASDSERIRTICAEVKKSMHLKSFPRIILVNSLLTKDQINGLHQRSNCYVSLHRCEGFGIPLVEAMMAGKPVITTGYGGPIDFIKNEETGYLIPYMMTPVSGMPWSTYQGDMNWAEPDLIAARKIMRKVYEDRNTATHIGQVAQQYVVENLSFKKIGSIMVNRLKLAGVNNG